MIEEIILKVSRQFFLSIPQMSVCVKPFDDSCLSSVLVIHRTPCLAYLSSSCGKKQLCLRNKFPQSFVLLSHLKFLMWTFL